MITAEQPNVILTARYSIGEASKVLGICRATLLKYAKEGKIKFGIRRTNGRKFFLGSEILRLWKATY